MLEQFVEPATTVDTAMRAYSGSATGWEKASEYVYAQPSPQGPDQKVVDTALRRHSVHPLPATFASQMNQYQYRSYMGLFPQLRAAWLTVDSNLFLWSYDLHDASGGRRSSDLYVYEGIQQVIVSVAVVSPRPGVFVESVRWLVAVATSVEVTLLGVEFSPAGEVNLVPTHISIATDNVLMLKIVSTPDGRIFMAGADGSLHEFVYQSNPRSGFFDLLSGRPVKRARKVVHSKSSLVDYFPSYLKTIFAKRDELVDIVADSSRGALYTLSQSGSLTVYNICNPTSTSHVSTVNVAHESRNLVSFSAPAGEREYVSLHVVSSSCLVSVHIIVVTSFGERIYFSVAGSASSVSTSVQAAQRARSDFVVNRPRTLICVGYRPSPDRTISRSTRPCVHNAWCERGAAVFADLRPANVDRLIVVHPDSQLGSALSEPRGSRPGTVRSKEVVMEVLLDEIGGGQSGSGPDRMSTPFGTQPATGGDGDASNSMENRTFAIADASATDTVGGGASTDPIPFDPPGSFLVLSATALYVYERIPPVVRLTEILEAGGGAASDVSSFFERHGTAEAFSMCLEIAITSPTLQRAAASVLYTYGEGGSEDKHDLRGRGSGGRRPELDLPYTYPDGKVGSGNAADSYFDIGRPSLQVTPQSRLSGAHDGVSLYIAKIVYPIWNEYLTSERNPDGFQSLVAPRDILVRIRDQLLRIVSFLENYPADAMFRDSSGFESHRTERRDHSSSRNRLSLLRPNDTPRSHDHDRMNVDTRGRYTTRENIESMRRRSSSIAALKKLAERIVEALAFLLILEDHQLHRLAVSLSNESRALLANIRFCEFVASDEGMSLSAALVEAIFGGYGDGMVALSRVGGILRERCPGYFQASDVELHRGLALLREAAQVVSGVAEERRTSEESIEAGWSSISDRSTSALIEAQNYAETAAKILKSVPSRIHDIDAVCKEFETAQAIPSMIGVAITVGKWEEARGKHERAEVAYDAILRAIGPFVNIGNAEEGISEDNCLVDYERLRESSMQVVLNADSEAFLRKLYEFLLKSKAGEEVLLNSSGASLEKYLEETKRLDILWRYCAQQGRYFEAAGVLLHLSESGEDTRLVDRVNFLSCAMHNAKTAVVKGDNRAGALLAEVSDFLDVAKVQLRVREELLRRHSQTAEVENALEDLDSSVFGLSTLFNNYARPFNLYEASLEAFRCGEYRDDAYVRALWANIVDSEAAAANSPKLLGQKIEALGRDFFPSPVAFPTGYIIDLLERRRFKSHNLPEWGETNLWVCETMRGIGVHWPELVDGYRRLIEKPQQSLDGESSWSWSSQTSQFHLLAGAADVIEKWIKECAGVPLERGSRRGMGSLVRSEVEGAMRTITLCRTRLLGMSSSQSRSLAEKYDKLEVTISSLLAQ